MNNIEIGKYLLKKRKEQGITQAELASKLNVTYQAVSRWENGDSIPDIQTLDLLAKFYNVSIDEILQREIKQLVAKKQEQNMVKRNVAILMLITFVVFNILGISLFIIFGFFITPGNGIYNAIGIICLIMFGLVSHVGYNVYFYIFSKKERLEVDTYRRGYMMFLTLLMITPIAIISFPIGYQLVLFVFLSLLGILYSYFLSNKYIKTENLSSYMFNKNKKYKIILLVVIILMVPINPLFMFPFEITALIQIILFSILALK